MSVVQLATYKGKGLVGNALIRWWTGSHYSHCELVVDGMCYSSSVMDKGVRSKEINLKDGNWTLINLPWVDGEVVKGYFYNTDIQTYGWFGLLCSQLFNRNCKEEGAQFCSEWCASAIGLPNTPSYSPYTLSFK
jgi:hypothetical protein